MESKAFAISTLILRILTLSSLIACVVLLVTDKFSYFDDGPKITFKDIIAYRYVLSTAVIGAAYTLLQFPLVLYYACTEKRMINNGFLEEFDFYGDKLMSLLLATGVGAGFAVTFELKRLINELFKAFGTDEGKSQVDKFLNTANVATALLFVGFVCMVIISIFSSIHRTKSRGFFR